MGPFKNQQYNLNALISIPISPNIAYPFILVIRLGFFTKNASDPS